jgi:glutaryl-CoA dehydrogenase (non-decarboxylating)
MHFELPEEIKEMRNQARRFAQERIAPIVKEDEEAHRFRPEIVREMGELGFFGTVIPEEYGGLGLENGHMAHVAMTMEIAKVSASWGLPFNMQMLGPALTLVTFGTPEQKRKYVPGLVSGELLGSFAMTEPNTGSDVASMKTTAVPTEDGFVVNGNKTWISNAQVADVGLLYAKSDPKAEPAHKGISAFISELKGNPGISTVPITGKLGLHCSPTGEVYYEDAKLPREALLVGLGQGFKVCMTQLENTRLSCAARAVGVASACLEVARAYALERKQFGKRIADFQMIQADLAEMYVHHQAAELLVFKAAWKKDRGEKAGTEVSTAKYFAAEGAVAAANMAIKILGSYGFSTEYPVERFLRDAKSYQIVEGTSNIQKIIISRALLEE